MKIMTDDIIKILLDSTSLGVTIASFTQILPAISAFLAIIWILIRIFETKTVQEGIQSIYEVFFMKENDDGVEENLIPVDLEEELSKTSSSPE